MLHPSVPLARVVGDDASGDHVLGPPTLARLAAAALMGRLMARVEFLEREVVEEAREAGAGPAVRTEDGGGWPQNRVQGPSETDSHGRGVAGLSRAA